MIVVDTDVLLLAFAFQRDARQKDNRSFLADVGESKATTIYNLMEILGKLSFNLSKRQLDNYEEWLLDAYQLTLIWPYRPHQTLSANAFQEEVFARPFARMRAVKMPFLDSLILNLAERTPNASAFVTWNAKHFQAKSTLPVFTPAAYLEKSSI